MSDDTPAPPWLRPSPWAGDFECNYDLWALCMSARAVGPDHDPASKSLPEWLRWRSELAAALGLVEPGGLPEMPGTVRVEFTSGFEGNIVGLRTDEGGALVVTYDDSARVAKAVAAELRALASEADAAPRPTGEERTALVGYSYGWWNALQSTAARLRARADELDPPAPSGPPMEPILRLETTTGNVSDPRAVWSNPGGPAVMVTIGSVDELAPVDPEVADE